MKKKLAALLCGILCVSLLAVPVYAADGNLPPDEPSITITEGNFGGGEVTIVTGASDIAPISVTTGMSDGIPTLTKVYELPQGVDTGALTASFEQGGISYTVRDISSVVQPGQSDAKTVTQTETLETESKRPADIAAEAAPTLAYSEDGYTGQLALDVGAITVEENGHSSYRHRIEDVREYTNLDRNDVAYIPKTVLKNGATLQLENIEWVVMDQHPVDGRMVPNLFTAVATYAGMVTGSKADGYTATLTYSGTVTKTLPSVVIYTVVFHGEAAGGASEIGSGETAPATGAPESKGIFSDIFVTVLITLLSVACLVVAVVRIVQHFRAKRGGGDTDFDFNAEDYTAEDAYIESALAHSVFEDAAQIPQELPQQAYEPDEFNIDDLFNGGGL